MNNRFCPQCGTALEGVEACLRCGYQPPPVASKLWWGFEWKSRASLLGWPLVHIAIGRNKQTGRLLVAKGIIAVGQFAIGLVTVSQFGLGLLFAFSQFGAGFFAVGQFAVGVYFGLGQFATGVTAIGQLALGKYVLAQLGLGEHVWSTKIKDPIAIHYFTELWWKISGLISG